MPVPVLSPAVKELVNPTDAQIDEAARVLQLAFASDPLTPIFTGNDPIGKIAYLLFRAGIGAAAVGGALHVLVVPSGTPDNDSERIVGVAAWFPPGISVNSTPEQRAAGWDQFLEAAPPKLKEWWTGYFVPRISVVQSSCLPSGYYQSAWHLHLFGIAPEYQRNGYGKLMFKYTEAKAEETQSPIVLETATDLDILIYQRFGLGIVGEMKVESEHGNAKMFIMTKKWE